LLILPDSSSPLVDVEVVGNTGLVVCSTIKQKDLAVRWRVFGRCTWQSILHLINSWKRYVLSQMWNMVNVKALTQGRA